MPGLSGEVSLDGQAVEGARVAVVDTHNSDDPTQWTVVGGTTTDVSGAWLVNGLTTDSERYHAIVQYEDGGRHYNGESLPALTADPGMFPTAVGTSVSAHFPAVEAIPREAVARYVASDGPLTSTGDPAGDGDNVATWTDYFDGFDLTGGSPTLQTSVLNGEPVVDSDGTDDNLANGSISISTPATYFVVARLQNPSTTANLFDSDDGNNRHVLYWGDPENEWRLRSNGTDLNSGDSTTGWAIFAAVIQGSADSILRINGTEVARGSLPSSTLNGLTLFSAHTSIDTNYIGAQIAEFVPCDGRVSDTDIQLEEQRLNNAYSVF